MSLSPLPSVGHATRRVRADLLVPEHLLLLGLLVPVAGGKWGSYLGLPSLGIFLSDVMIAAGIVGMILTGRRLRSSLIGVSLMIVLGLFVFFYLATGQGPAILRLRDVSPLAYLACLPFVQAAITNLELQRVLQLVKRALAVHAAWAVPALLGVLPTISLPGPFASGFPIFDVRPDIDVLLLGVYATGFVVTAALSRPARISIIALIAMASVVQTSRAALAGGLLGALLVLAFRRRGLPSSRAVVSGFLVLAGLLIALASPSTVLPERLAGSGALARAGFGTSEGSAAVASGRGTASARRVAWEAVLDHYEAAGSPPLGLGAGAEIVAESGALKYLSGESTVRAPHSWWVHGYARFGIVGLGVWCAGLLLIVGAAIFRGPARDDEERFALALGLGLIVALLIAASLGVLVESPFGSQPLLLALAVVATRSSRTAGSGPLRMPAS